MEFNDGVKELLRLMNENKIPAIGKWLNFNHSVQKGFSEKKTDVMISYTWDPDKSTCEQIKSQLTQSGYCVWTDVGNMTGVMDKAISQAIVNTCCFIGWHLVFLSIFSDFSSEYRLRLKISFLRAVWFLQRSGCIVHTICQTTSFLLYFSTIISNFVSCQIFHI